MWEILEQNRMKSHVAALLGGSPDEVTERYRVKFPVELLPMKIIQVLKHDELDRHVPVK